MLLPSDVDCGQPENIEHGTWRLLSNDTFYTAQVAYECPENWKLDGRLRRFCQENGTWAGETPKCIGEDFEWVCGRAGGRVARRVGRCCLVRGVCVFVFDA